MNSSPTFFSSSCKAVSIFSCNCSYSGLPTRLSSGADHFMEIKQIFLLIIMVPGSRLPVGVGVRVGDLIKKPGRLTCPVKCPKDFCFVKFHRTYPVKCPKGFRFVKFHRARSCQVEDIFILCWVVQGFICQPIPHIRLLPISINMESK